MQLLRYLSDTRQECDNAQFLQYHFSSVRSITDIALGIAFRLEILYVDLRGGNAKQRTDHGQHPAADHLCALGRVKMDPVGTLRIGK